MKNITALSIKFYLLLAMLLAPSLVFAGDWNTNKKGEVLDGYDVVAYHTKDKAVKGKPMFAVTYDGATFNFSSKENRELFIKGAKKYIPKYNGFCAFAAANGKTDVPANADTFKMYNGELLVFFNDQYKGSKFNTKIPWNSNEKAMYDKAEATWKNR